MISTIESFIKAIRRGVKACVKCIFDNSDPILKLTGTFAILFGTWLATSYESKLTAVTLISEREQAESRLRASMFNNLISPISGPSKEEIDPHRECVLVELLALNFHEHFEFKPLMMHVDKRLSETCYSKDNNKKKITPQEAKYDRDSLRSIARRITDRQIKTLIKDGLDAPEKLSYVFPIISFDFNDIKSKYKKTLLQRLVKYKLAVKDANNTDVILFFNNRDKEFVNELRNHGFSENDIQLIMEMYHNMITLQDPIEVNKKDLKEKILVDRLLKHKIALEDTNDKRILYFPSESKENLEASLMENGFKEEEIKSLLRIYYPHKVEKEEFKDKTLVEKLVEQKIALEDPAVNNILFFSDFSKDELEMELMGKGFPDEEIKKVMGIRNPPDSMKSSRLKNVSTIPAPGKSRLYIRISRINIINETLDVFFIIKEDNAEIIKQEFTLTWYDFPFTDYTILRNGERLSIVLSKMEHNHSTSKYDVELKIIWYPKDYFTARERPIKYTEFRNYLGI